MGEGALARGTKKGRGGEGGNLMRALRVVRKEGTSALEIVDGKARGGGTAWS